MNQTKSVKYEIKDIPEFMLEQLTTRKIPAFFPASFVNDGATYTGVYQTGDYRPLSQLPVISTKDMMTLLCCLFEKVSENEKHYFFPEYYAITKDTVYVDLTTLQVKLVFVPLEVLTEAKGQFHSLLKECRGLVGLEGRSYMDEMIKYMERDDVSYYSAIRHGEMLKNEIYICDIP